MSTTGNTIVFPVNGARSTLYPLKNVKLDSYIPLFTKVIFTWFVDLNVNNNTIKLITEIILKSSQFGNKTQKHYP